MGRPTSEQVEAFRRDGAVYLPGFLAPELVERLAAGVERDLAEPGPLAITMEPADGSGRFVEDFCRWQRHPRVPRGGGAERHRRRRRAS